ncbi:hypothetical protein VTL71DRAFT_4891 [Oculimacula yallundae]|uniref:Uncharacterized protein n=1 Tax=Oculimacula yallundae TaxID=86028 RepID=A0ABR4C4E9_9HELO
MSLLSTGSNSFVYPGYYTRKAQVQENPHLVLTHDIVRNIKTLHFEINRSEPLSPNREYLQRSMKGYFGVMAQSACSSCDLHGNGSPVHLEDKHCLWQPKDSTETKEEPLWHLRVSVLKDQEVRGDCQSRRFAFKSLHHLTHAANQLDAAFKSFDIKKCGVSTPDAMGGRVNDGRSENITIEFESDASSESWKEFLARLKALEDEWEHEGMSVL